MPNFIHLFPLTVFQTSVSVAPQERQRMVDAIIEMGQVRVNQNTPGVSWTGDVNGHELLHNDPRFQTLFAKFQQPLNDYLELFHLDRNRVQLYFTRSWGTLSGQGDSTRAHRHMQSHISLVYYLKKPSDSSGISFVSKEPPNQFAPNLFNDAMFKSGVLKKMQQSNALRIYIEPGEDDVLIFPSKAMHEIPLNQSKDPRVSIACDIVMTLQDSSRLEFLLPDPASWRALD